MELTILMPCLNEAMTVESCIRKARDFLAKRNITGEVLVADNGSTDGSPALAEAAGARVIQIGDRGYGATLIAGIKAANGRFVIMGDADDSYDFTDLDGFMDRLRGGYNLVVGNRFTGAIKPGAMPILNRYVGNPLLSFVGRTLFASPVGDFHCGMRGFEKQSILDLHLRARGMEFASEMVVKATLAHLKVTETPTTLSPDGRQREPHLRRWRDGWRHLRFMLLRSPQWLFLYPGLILTVVGLIGTGALIPAPIKIDGYLTLDINSLLFFSVAAVVGTQITFFGLFALALARKMQLRIIQEFPEKLLRLASDERAMIIGLSLIALGVAGVLYALLQWGHTSFGALIPSEMMRITIPAAMSLAIGTQILFSGFLLGFIEIE
jgi:glycosyltransferase involved in cell wall biosynthesis